MVGKMCKNGDYFNHQELEAGLIVVTKPNSLTRPYESGTGRAGTSRALLIPYGELLFLLFMSSLGGTSVFSAM
jgi:hypothetical protein